LLFGGLETMRHNTNRQRPNLRVFEFGKCYSCQPNPDQKNALDKYHEQMKLALFLTGKKNEPNWLSQGNSSGFYELKAHVENTLSRLGYNINTLVIKPLEGSTDLFDGGLVYTSRNKVLAEIAIVKKQVLKRFDIKNEVFYADVHWEDVLKIRGEHQVRYSELPRFPEVRRDLALLLDKSVTFDKVKELAYKIESKLLLKVDLFDVYEGEQVGADKKSYAVSFILQDKETTLTDEKIDKILQKLMDAYSRELGAVSRK
jgi:phenylalanyl-tRNA synthetase beta chain